MKRSNAAKRIDHAVRTPSGASAHAEGETLVVRAPDGAIVVTYDAVRGETTIVAPGDLSFAAAGKIALKAPEVEIVADRARTQAREIHLVAESLASVVGKWELRARRVVEQVVDVYRDVEGVEQSRIGRARILVKELYQVLAARTEIDSSEDTVIDGKRVLLG